MSQPIETLDGLKRKLTVTISDDRIAEKTNERLKKLAPQVRLKGFRPGKVPAGEIKRRFGPQVRFESIEELVNDTFNEAVKEHDLKLAGSPDIEPLNLEEGKPVSYEATFEVFPEVKLAKLDKIKLTRYAVEFGDKDIDDMLEKMRKQNAEWEDVERAAKDGDKVLIDFDGTIKGEPLEGGKAESFDLELGNGNMIDGFESGIVGAKPGDELELKLKFPKEYHAKEIAGKPVVFKIKVIKVREAKLPALDDDFAKKLEIEGGIDNLRDDIKSNMQRDTEQRARQQLKTDLTDKVVELNKLDIPNAMLDSEIENVRQGAAQSMQVPIEELDHVVGDSINFEEQARKNVALGLIFAQVAEEKKLEVTDELVDKKLEEFAASFSSPKSIIQMYKSNPQMLEQVKGAAMEDLIVDTLLEETKLTDKSVAYDKFNELLSKESK